LIGLDAEVTWYPSDFPARPQFSQGRFEGLFGVTVGPKLPGARPFVKAAAGFLDVSRSPSAFPCLAIYPPPLSCQLAGGQTLQAYDLGGGLEIDAPARVFIRGDVSGRILKYPGPAINTNREVRDAAFFGIALRFTLGAGIRF
jgi:hypothetical protein